MAKLVPNDPDVVKATITLDGSRVDATWRSGILQWRGTNTAGRLNFQQQVYGYQVGSSTVTIFTFETVQKGFSCFGGIERQQKEIRLEFSEDDAHSQWSNLIQEWFESSGRPKKLLVLVNPAGGSGQANKNYSKIVEPMFHAAGIQVTKQETKFYRHAVEIAQELDLGAYDGVVSVSGDGILVEILNGLLSREDWREAIKTPLGIIPSGSGNGAAKSVSSISGEDCTVMSATFNVIKGHKRKVDVATISQGEKRFHSILNITWGIVSDVDIESEKYRWMGGFRLTFQSVVRILSLRKYGGTISYLPAESAPPAVAADESATDSKVGFRGAPVQPLAEREHLWETISGEFILMWIQNLPWAATDMHSHPHAQFSDGFLDMIIVRNSTKLNLLKLFLKMENGSHLNSEEVEYKKVRAVRIEPGGRTRGNVAGGIISVDGEVIARGTGAVGRSENDLMNYNDGFEVTVQQGLATIYAPS